MSAIRRAAPRMAQSTMWSGRSPRTNVTLSPGASVCTHLNGTVSPAKAGVQKG